MSSPSCQPNPLSAFNPLRLFSSYRRDLSGIGCSALCITHCLLTPLLLSSTAASSLTGGGVLASISLALSGEQTHQWLLVLVWLLALLSFPAGWMQHRRWQPLLAAFAGLALLSSATQFHGDEETILTVAGALTMAMAHFSNRHFLKRRVKKGG